MGKSEAGKGDSPRPVDIRKYGANYDLIFRRRKITNKKTKGDKL